MSGESDQEYVPHEPPKLDEEDLKHQICLICKKEDHFIEFAAWPCGCPSMCSACALKLATGGKCRVCKELFPEVKRVVHPTHTHRSH